MHTFLTFILYWSMVDFLNLIKFVSTYICYTRFSNMQIMATASLIGASLVAQTVKNLPAMQETRV